MPNHKIPKESLPAEAVYKLVHNELNLNGSPVLNLGAFSTTWMEPEAHKLAIENLNKNLIDHDEYSQTEKIHHRVIKMIRHLFHAPDCTDLNKGFMGTATVGSSEAVMLGLLAHKWNWKLRQEQEGKPTNKPDLLVGAGVHTCWHKFALYFDVDMTVAPMEDNRCILTANRVREYYAKQKINQNTIAVGLVLGNTYTGEMDEIEEINQALEEIKEKEGWNIPIHIDAASGGFIIPFTYPDLKWDFRLSHVRSINVSNHKFGLVYPGMGSVVFRDPTEVPDELIFKIDYLGNKMDNYSLNFSRSSLNILLQYYNFLRLGIEGYTRIMETLLQNTKYLADKIEGSQKFKVLGDIEHFPIISFKLTKNDLSFNASDISKQLRDYGWIVPAYTLPENAENVEVLRIVIKENFNRDIADRLFEDIKQVLKKLEQVKRSKIPTLSTKTTHYVCSEKADSPGLSVQSPGGGL